MRNIVEIASEHAQGQAVQRISLAVGELTAVVPQALRFCFDSAARGTVLEQARLEIEEIEGRAHCENASVISPCRSAAHVVPVVLWDLLCLPAMN